MLDLRKVSSFCDYFVILSGKSIRQVGAFREAIEDDLAREGVKPLSGSNSSQDESGWAVLDFSDVVAHIFYEPKRDFYALERLWSEAKKVRIPSERK